MIDGLTLPHCAKGRAFSNAETGLFVRMKPVDGAILGSLKPGEFVTVWAVVNGWAIVQTDDGRLTGWTFMDYLTVSGELQP